MLKRKSTESTAPSDNHEMSFNSLSQEEFSKVTLMGIPKFGAETLLAEAVKAEVDQYLGRDHYEHIKIGEKSKGERNGYRKTTIDTPLGPVTYDRQQVAYAPEFVSKFHTAYMRRPEEFSSSIADMYVNGISTRKVKDALKAVAGDKIKLSKSTVSRVTKRLRSEFTLWRKKDLSDLDVAYLFLDGIRVGMRMGQKGKDVVMVAYAVLRDGSHETLSIDLGQSESNRGWGKFVSDLKSRGLKDPLLVGSDGNPGVINAIDSNFPTSYRQRCLKHRFDNILDAVPKESQQDVAKILNQIFYGATSLAQAKQFIKNFKKEFSKAYPTAVSRLEEDLDQCLTFYLFPSNHWKRIRTSNKLERLNKEIRRRMDVIGRHPDELGCLSLIYQVGKKYAVTQKSFKANDIEKAIWKKLREDKVQMLEQLVLDLVAA